MDNLECRNTAAEKEEKFDDSLRALRQTQNKGRDHAWKLRHRAVRTDLENVWAKLRDKQRKLDADLVEKMEHWDIRHAQVADNIAIADHVLEAVMRHNERAESQTVTDDDPSGRFNWWWLRLSTAWGVGGLGFLGVRASWTEDFLDYGHLAVKSVT